MEKQDKTIVCKDCGKEFVFTVRDQEFYAEKGYANEPQRCKDCRDKKKLERGNRPSFGGNRNGGFGGNRFGNDRPSFGGNRGGSGFGGKPGFGGNRNGGSSNRRGNSNRSGNNRSGDR
jgi:hypothetical protein